MKFTETSLPGTFVVELEPIADERGFLALAWSREEFAAHGVNPEVAQCNLSYNRTRGTLRGLHFQIAPREETKVVRCIAGAILDVAVDLRSHSPTYRKWFAIELSARNRTMLVIPPGLAHGFQTLEDESEAYYHVSEFYSAPHARGVRWDDPAIGIRWPLEVSVISERDCHHPPFEDLARELRAGS